MKNFLLIAGDNYYPGAGTSDWIDRFETYQEAFNEILEETKDCHVYFRQGKKKGMVKEYRWITTYTIDGRKFDWFEIVDLDTWVKNQY